MPTGGDRRLATFLFLDVVGSTALAAELGDRRWREVLHRFRRSVHERVKAHGGTEQDWAGDGLFATFPDPARAIRASADIAGSAQELGLEVRCGVHTGEAETVEGKLAGIGVHLAARVMAVGGAAEIHTTGTVRDLVTGSHIAFEDLGTRELKGIPGEWPILRVTAIEDEPVPRPLQAEVLAARAAQVEAQGRGRRRRSLIVLGGAAFGVAAALTLLIAFSGGEDPETPAADDVDERPITVADIDTATGDVDSILRDDAYSEHLWGILDVADGFLWQVTNETLVQRDVETGAILNELPLPDGWRALDGGFGYVWVATPSSPDETEISRISPLSGATKTFAVDGSAVDLRAGNGAVWMLSSDGTLTEIDPVKGKVVDTYPTDATRPGVVVPLAGYVWICECETGQIVQFDPRTGTIVRELDLPAEGFLFGVDSTDPDTARVWLLDPGANTLTPIDPSTGEVGRPIGIGGAAITDATIVADSLWVSSQTEVSRIELPDLETHEFEVPEGISAGSIAPTPDGAHVWVANCGCPIQN
jgi:class 3 adenylate cyclase/streptogramin lyase